MTDLSERDYEAAGERPAPATDEQKALLGKVLVGMKKCLSSLSEDDLFNSACYELWVALRVAGPYAEIRFIAARRARIAPTEVKS